MAFLGEYGAIEYGRLPAECCVFGIGLYPNVIRSSLSGATHRSLRRHGSQSPPPPPLNVELGPLNVERSRGRVPHSRASEIGRSGGRALLACGRGSLLTLLDSVTHGGRRTPGRGLRAAVRLHRLARAGPGVPPIIDAQDILITRPAETEPTRDGVTDWDIVEAPIGDDPLDALIVRLATAYEEPRPLKFHFDDVGSAAGRAAELADPTARVGTRDEVLTAGDYLSAYVLEWTLHHLDLIAYLPDVAEPPAEGLARSRELLEKIAGAAFPASFSDKDALLVGTGRRARPTARKPRWASWPRNSRSSSADRSVG